MTSRGHRQSNLPPLTDAARWYDLLVIRELTYTQIAEMFPNDDGSLPSKQAVHGRCKALELQSLIRRQVRINGHVPDTWRVPAQWGRHHLLRRLHDLGRRDAGRAVESPVALERWIKFMANATAEDGTPLGRGVVILDLVDGFSVGAWREGDLPYARPWPVGNQPVSRNK